MLITATTMIMIITTTTEAIAAEDDWPACGVVSGILDDTGDIADAEVDEKVPGTKVDCTLEVTAVE